MGYSHIFLCFITTSYQSDAGQYNNILGSNSNMLHQKNKFIPSQLTHYQVPLDPQTSSPETTFGSSRPDQLLQD